MADNNPEEKKSTRVDLWSKGLTLIREGILILLLILLLIWPSSINAILQNAGFTEADFGPIKWKKTLEESNTQTESALQTIDQLKGQLDALETKLATVQSTTTEPAVRRSVDSALAGVQALQDSTTAVNKSLQTSYINSKVLLESIKQNKEVESLAPIVPQLRKSIPKERSE